MNPKLHFWHAPLPWLQTLGYGCDMNCRLCNDMVIIQTIEKICLKNIILCVPLFPSSLTDNRCMLNYSFGN